MKRALSTIFAIIPLIFFSIVNIWNIQISDDIVSSICLTCCATSMFLYSPSKRVKAIGVQLDNRTDKMNFNTFGEFYKVTDGKYVPVGEPHDMTVSLTKEPDITMSAVINEPITFTLEGTLTGASSDEIVFDLFHPVRCNCRNCGAPVRLNYCEYCGTQYPLDFQGRFKIEK